MSVLDKTDRDVAPFSPESWSLTHTQDAPGYRPEDARPANPGILHVVESFAGGVAAAVHDYVRSTPHLEHHLLYATRADAPLSETALLGFDSVEEFERNHFKRVRQVRRVAKARRCDVVHAHSSLGGAYTRVAVSKSEVTIAYTPHCYSYEREDLSGPKRAAYRAIEWMLAWNTSVFAACSPREAELSRRSMPSNSVVYVPHVKPRGRGHTRRNSPVRTVLASGRLGAQKDPEFFAQLSETVQATRDDIDFVWVGGGDQEIVDRLRAAGVRVTGWLDRRAVLREMAAADLYVHVAKWEGYPVTILEAVSAGLPVIVRDAPSMEYFPEEARVDSLDAAARMISVMDDASVRSLQHAKWAEWTAMNNTANQLEALNSAYAA
ncbi:glycosyltransferase family 4 protein [Planctomonas psychrotolerans]|uniref:glycosyltransferase family 4 protein n=1 Tax=Planctomonas psychrotolerans TaxID=2528712 RepID=UPI00123993FB|nr:glycosyltransferase family 4 protein [Planctomonas psychrotolerans]